MFFRLAIILTNQTKQNDSSVVNDNNNVNKNNDKDDNNNNHSNYTEYYFEMLTFDKSVLNKLENIKGDFQYGYKWKDKMGYNILIFTTQNKFVEMKDAEYDDFGDNYRYLKAYHFAGSENNYSLVRLVQDGAEPCSSNPFNLENEFYKNSISITDLNNNGYAEITFMYFMLCSSELTPVPTKLILLENGKKYAIRGNSYISDFDMGGDKKLDLADADRVLIEYASETWDKFCTPKPN